MDFKILNKNNKQEIVALFTQTFSSSEGEKEGVLIGELVSNLASNINNKDIIAVGACKNESIIGVIFFTRLSFNESISVLMLAPVAVSTSHQGEGVGQALINFGIEELKSRSVKVLTTYGDPAFYSKVGFKSLSEQVIQAPLTLSMPEGWLGQSLTDNPIPTINEGPVCVEEFNNPALW